MSRRVRLDVQVTKGTHGRKRLHAREQARILKLLVEGISFDGAAGTAVVAFRAAGIQALAEEIQA